MKKKKNGWRNRGRKTGKGGGEVQRQAGEQPNGVELMEKKTEGRPKGNDR